MVFSRTELIRRMRRFQVANHSCLMIKYSKDDRYDRSSVATHDKLVIACVDVSPISLSCWRESGYTRLVYTVVIMGFIVLMDCRAFVT